MEIRLTHNHTAIENQPQRPVYSCRPDHGLPDRIYLERAPHSMFEKEGIEVVLAYLPDNATTPYVVWDHKDGNDHSGDYFNELPAALDGFLKRIGRFYKGWGWLPQHTTKQHYFVEGKSLCGKFKISVKYLEVAKLKERADHPTKCAICHKKRDTQES